MILAGDIGGTKVNLAFFELRERGLVPAVTGTYPSREHASLIEIVRDFVGTHNLKVDFACFGIAGPVKGGRVEVTNLPWVVDSHELTRALSARQVWLVNDLEANAHGIGGLAPEDFFELNRGQPDIAGNIAVISAGTGLGEAGLLWEGNRHLAIASEGGHANFAPRTDLDVELLRYLRARLGEVSWENVLSGPGVVNIYEFLRDTGRGEEPAWLKEDLGHADRAAVITQAGLAGKSPICVQTLDMLVTYYGMEAGNLGLKLLATGGVYVGGGVAPKILPKLRDGTFVKAFIGQGRMKNLLAAMPVRVILNDKTALIGAARYAAVHAGKAL